jgi:hypothetical protein
VQYKSIKEKQGCPMESSTSAGSKNYFTVIMHVQKK